MDHTSFEVTLEPTKPMTEIFQVVVLMAVGFLGLKEERYHFLKFSAPGYCVQMRTIKLGCLCESSPVFGEPVTALNCHHMKMLINKSGPSSKILHARLQ
jgi:hypothetical protein